MFNVRSIRTLDVVIAVIAVLVLALGAYLGYSVWTQNKKVVQAAPASRAVDDLVAEVRANPNNLAKRMELAQALSVAGRDEEAIRQYQAVLKINETYVPALSGMGFIALKNQEWKKGQEYFERVIGLLESAEGEGKNDALETAYFYMGTALMEQRQYEEAAQNFTEALRLRRDASDTHYALAVAFREMGNERKYRESLENALLFDPKMPEANYDLGTLLLEQGEVAPAAEHFRASADAAPAVAKPQDALAKLGTSADRLAKAKQLMKTDVKKALVEARVAVALDPKSVDALMTLASLYEKDKNREEALKVYVQTLAVDPNNAAAKAGVERAGK